MVRLEIVNKQINELEKSEYNLVEVGKLYEKYNSIKEVTRKIINEFVKKSQLANMILKLIQEI